MKLYQSASGYRYNSDSLFLYDFILNYANFKGGALLDVGCGCGILGLLLARDYSADAKKSFKLSSIDIQPLNIELTTKNAELNGIKTNAICADFIIYAQHLCKTNEKFDLIISNPPFYNFGYESANSHKNLSRENKNMHIASFIKACSSLLAPRGKLAFCYDARFLDEIIAALASNKLKLNKLRFIYPKENKSAKVALFLCAKSSRSPCEILPPLYTTLNATPSPEAQSIYNKASLTSLDYEI